MGEKRGKMKGKPWKKDGGIRIRKRGGRGKERKEKLNYVFLSLPDVR